MIRKTKMADTKMLGKGVQWDFWYIFYSVVSYRNVPVSMRSLKMGLQIYVRRVSK
jgi:hypothetical protein